MQKTLDVLLAKDFSTYLWYSFKACILKTNLDTHSWFKNRFLNIVSYNAPYAPWKKAHTWLKLDYIEHNAPESTFQDLLEFYSYNSKSVRHMDVADFVKSALCQHKYIQLEVDEYYVSAKDHYYKNHFYHPVLIYGFDDWAGTFQCIGFGKHNVFVFFTMTQLELYESAYSAADMIKQVSFTHPHYDTAAVTIKRHDAFVPEFDHSLFRNSLTQFVYSVPNPVYDWVMGGIDEVNRYSYGIDALKNIPLCIRKDSYEDLDVAYLDFVFLQERVVGLYTRLRWYIDNFTVSEHYVFELLDRYEKLVKDYKKFYFVVFREYVTSRDFFITNSSKKIEIANALEDLIFEEQEILDKLIVAF